MFTIQLRNKLSFLLIILLSIGGSITAQQQGNNWYFGDHAGITFNTVPPSPLFNSALYTSEGCSTISDENGQLLFYTDGVYVYNKNHQVMPNGTGLMGNFSSTNSAIIVRKPGSKSLYYIFTADANENNFANGYRYSIVDISLKAGLGDITAKNISLYAKGTEKITAVRHNNGRDIWIITKDFDSNTFKVFLLSCSGLNLTPVISNTGYNYNKAGDPRFGSIKSSPDGSKIATVYYSKGWEIFNFNKTTGQLNNSIFISFPYADLFGIEFSPNAKIMYLSSEGIFLDSNTTTRGGTVYQYKIDVYDSLLITNSKYIVAQSEIRNADMQLGPDGKIYVPNELDSFLNIISNPNSPGAACNYLYKAINLGEGRLAIRCLPAFLKDDIINTRTDFTYTTSSDCRSVTFIGSTSLPQPLTWQWSFGDGTTGIGKTVSHSYPTDGNFTVNLSINSDSLCEASGTKTKIVNINTSTPVANFGYVLQCGSKSIQFVDSSFTSSGNIESWVWRFGDGETDTLKNPMHTYTNYGLYKATLEVTNSGVCKRKDSISFLINVVAPGRQKVFLGNDTVFCKTLPYLLNAGAGFKNYRWQNGSTDSTLTVTQSGKYFIKANDYCNNEYSDTINIVYGIADAIMLGDDTNICINNRLSLDAGKNFVKYLWNTGETNQIINVNSTGQYSVIAINNYGCTSKDTLKVLSVFPSPFVEISKQSRLCLNQNNIIKAGSGFHSWLWQDGSTDSSITVKNPGVYKVTVSNAYNCFSSDSVTIIRVVSPPANFVDTGIAICKGETIMVSANQVFNEYNWSTGSVNKVVSVNFPGQYWLSVKDINGCVGRDTVNIYNKECSPYFYIPNAFTPNNDYKNDVFKPVINEQVTEYVFSVYNRYGQIVFSTNQSNAGWDGTFNGRPQGTGTFIWLCSFKQRNGFVKIKKGTVVLLRQ